MESQEFDVWMTRARQELEWGAVHRAIESLKRALGVEPDSAEAHAVLSLALLSSKRLHAARHEASIALTLEPEAPGGHFALGRVLIAMRKFGEARKHLDHARDLDPTNSHVVHAIALIEQLAGNHEKRLALLEEALALDPEDETVLCALGDYHLEARELGKAEQFARAVLEGAPEHVDGLVLMGRIHLLRGAVEDARQHAIWALRSDASDSGALHLLASIKARKSPLLGVWWRMMVWLGSFGDGRAILILLGAFVLQRFGSLYTHQNGMPTANSLISFGWLGLCVYSWVGPALFQRKIQEELQSVELDANF
jgi:tetratricopeptide (TPR) repeat protein